MIQTFSMHKIASAYISIVTRLYSNIDKIEQHLLSLPMGVIHGDMHEYNLLFNKEEDELSGILDWESMIYAPLIGELAMAMVEWCNDCRNDKFYYCKENVDYFIECYENEGGRLVNEERKAFNVMALLMFLFQADFMASPAIRHNEEGRLQMDKEVPFLEKLLEMYEIDYGLK